MWAALKLGNPCPSDWFRQRSLQLLRYRADAYGERQDETHALADFAEAIRLAPNDRAAYADRAIYYKEHDRVPEAIDDLSTALRLERRSPPS